MLSKEILKGNISNKQQWLGYSELAAVNQHPPAHHPPDAHYHSVVDEPQLR
jgi:hypothetical protein